MLTSLRTRFKSLRKDHDASSDARLLRQARKAERRVIQTATADLETWELGQGYVKTSCRTGSSPALSFRETELPGADSERMLWEGKNVGEELGKEGLGTSSLSGPYVQQKVIDSVPQITLSAIDHEDIGLLAPLEETNPAQSLETGAPPAPTEVKAASASPSQEDRQAELEDTAALKVLAEKESLLREIQQIRKTISDLRTGATSSSLLSEKPADAAPPTPESTPWLSTTRTISVYRPRRKSVADLFAEDAPQPMQPYHARGIASSTAPQRSLSPELEAAASSMPAELIRRRSRSLGASTLLVEGKRASANSGGTPRPSAHRKTSTTAAARPKTFHEQPSSLQAGKGNEQRRILVSEKEQSQRYRASLGRMTTKATSAGRDNAANVRMSEMTLSELQERHLAKLLQLQRPTTTKLAEAQALTTAREQWRQRQAAERQAQEVKLRERQVRDTQFANEATGTKSRGQSFRYSIRGRSKSALSPAAQLREDKPERGPEAKPALERSSTSISAQLDAYNRPPRRGEAIKRAGEWRKSVPSLSSAHISEEERLPARVVRKPPPSRAQSSLGLTAPREAYQEQAAQPRSYRSHSSAGLLTISQEIPGPAPLVPEAQMQGTTGGEQPRPPRRELTATDIRRMREGAGRRRSTLLP